MKVWRRWPVWLAAVVTIGFGVAAERLALPKTLQLALLAIAVGLILGGLVSILRHRWRAERGL